MGLMKELSRFSFTSFCWFVFSLRGISILLLFRCEVPQSPDTVPPGRRDHLA